MIGRAVLPMLIIAGSIGRAPSPPTIRWRTEETAAIAIEAHPVGHSSSTPRRAGGACKLLERNTWSGFRACSARCARTSFHSE